jgi:hypothetical protein
MAAVARAAAIVGLVALIVPGTARAEGDSIWDYVDETKTAPASCPAPATKPRQRTTLPLRGAGRGRQPGLTTERSE